MPHHDEESSTYDCGGRVKHLKLTHRSRPSRQGYAFDDRIFNTLNGKKGAGDGVGRMDEILCPDNCSPGRVFEEQSDGD